MKSVMILNLNQNMQGQGTNNELPEIQFEHLNEPPQVGQELLSQITYSIKSSNWVESIQCITMIRSINKFFPQANSQIMDRYSPALLDLLSNGKTQIVKHILRLIKEVFNMGQQINVQRTVFAFLPILLKKASNQIGHIKDLSQEVLTSFAANCGYDVSFQISAEYSCDKSSQVAEISFKLFAALIQRIGNSITQLTPGTLKVIMLSLFSHIQGKRTNMKNSALDTCMFIYNVIGSENYINLMNYSLDSNQVGVMGRAMESHRVDKVKPVPLANVLKQRRTMVIRQQNQNFPNNMQNGQQQNYYGQNQSNYQTNNGYQQFNN